LHDWQNWAIPALVVALVPLIAAIWRGGERLTKMEQHSEQHRTELNAHADQLKTLDSRIDGQNSTLIRVENKLDMLIEWFKSLGRIPGPPSP